MLSLNKLSNLGVLTAAVGACVIFAACSAGAGPPTAPHLQPATAVAAPSAGLELPPVTNLLRGVSTSTSDADRVRAGDMYDPQLPHAHVSGSNFSSQAGATGLTGAAYAVFSFKNIHAYVGAATLKPFWLTGSDIPAKYYVGLANFESERWDWFSTSGAGTVSLPSFGPYYNSSGDLFACLLLRDSGSFELDYFLLGPAVAPLADLTTDLDPDPQQNIGPKTVNFDARGSRAFGGEIVSYDFDFDGDSVYEESGNTSGQTSHLYQPGQHSCNVRVNDSNSRSSLDEAIFLIIDPNNQAPVPSFTCTPPSGNSPLQVNLDASASSDPEGGKLTYLWDFENDGNFDATSASAQTGHTFAISGVRTIRLRVEDQYFAHQDTTRQISVLQGWHTSLVEDQAAPDDAIALCVTGIGVNSRACCAYSLGGSGILHFAAAANLEGGAWSAIREPMPGNHIGYTPSLVTGVVSGCPLLLCGGGGAAAPLYLLRADDSAGSSWAAPLLVDDTREVGRQATLGLVNTIPVIAAVSHSYQPGQTQVLYYTAGDLDGNSWNVPTVVAADKPGLVHGRPLIGVGASGLFHKPILAWNNQDSGPYHFSISRSDNIDGTSWAAPFDVGGRLVQGRISVIGGKASLCNGPGIFGQSCYFMQSTDGDGQSWPDNLPAVNLSGVEADMLVVDGRLLLFSYDNVRGALQVQTSSDLSGTSWEAAYDISAPGNKGVRSYFAAALLNGLPEVVYYWAGGAQNQVRCQSYY